MKIIAYYRVSTSKQGQSGLGLEAQRQAVMNYLNGGDWQIVAEFTEVESGRRSNRPELDKALAAARVHQCPLVVSKVDRLTRSVAFISRLLEAEVDVRFVKSHPSATPFSRPRMTPLTEPRPAARSPT
jgi:DNA invertase Pin-like site-specific DNA recombinase